MFVVPTIFTAKDQFSQPVNKMKTALTQLTVVGGINGAKLKNTLSGINVKAMEIASSGAMLGAAILVPLGLATKAAMDFEKQMTNVATLVDTTRENMGAMGDALLEISERVPVAISDLTESLYQIRSAGIDAAHAMNVLEISAKLSVAGLSSATDATKAVTSAMVSFKDQGLTAEQIANSFFLTVKEGKTKMDALNESFGSTAPIIATAGVKLQEFNAATAALTNSGMTASEAQTALRGATIALIKPTSEMADVLQQMGFMGADAGQKLIAAKGGLVPAMEAVKAAAGPMGDSINKAFGRVQGLTAFTLLTGNLKDQFLSNLKEQVQGVDSLTEAFRKQLGTTAAQSQLAKNELTILGIRMGELLLPALTSLLKIMTPIIHGLSNFFHAHKTLGKIILWTIGIVGAFVAVVSVLAFTVGTVTKAIWLWQGAAKILAFTQGALAAVTGSLNGELLVTPGLAEGATAAFVFMNGGALTLLGTLTKIAAVLVVVYGAYKLLQRKDEHAERMKAVLNHLPAGVDREKFSNQFQDIVSPGHISLLDRARGVKDFYPQETFDTLAAKYYDDPKRQMDSIQDNHDNDYYKQAQDIKTADSTQNHIHLNVNIDKSGNVSVESSGNARVTTPSIGSTWPLN